MKKSFTWLDGIWSLCFMSFLTLVLMMASGCILALMWKAFMVGWNFTYWFLS